MVYNFQIYVFMCAANPVYINFLNLVILKILEEQAYI
jgi:hypothetical protein